MMGTLLVGIKLVDGYSEGALWSKLFGMRAPSSASDRNIYENINGDNNMLHNIGDNINDNSMMTVTKLMTILTNINY